MVRAKQSIDAVFFALGDPTRRKIVGRLSRGPATVSSLSAPLDISVTAVSQHLQVLERCGLVVTHKQGRVRTCRIRRDGFVILENWIDQQKLLWESRLDRLGELLSEDD